MHLVRLHENCFSLTNTSKISALASLTFKQPTYLCSQFTPARKPWLLQSCSSGLIILWMPKYHSYSTDWPMTVCRCPLRSYWPLRLPTLSQQWHLYVPWWFVQVQVSVWLHWHHMHGRHRRMHPQPKPLQERRYLQESSWKLQVYSQPSCLVLFLFWIKGMQHWIFLYL